MNQLPQDTPPGVLIVDDEENTLALLRQLLQKEMPVHTASSGKAAIEALEHQHIGVLVCDQRMAGMQGTEVLGEVAKRFPSVFRILMTAWADVDTLSEAINSGQIHRYISKPWNNQDLRMTIRGALENYTLRRRNQQLGEENVRLVQELSRANAELERENVSLRREVQQSYQLDNIVGVSAPMKETFRLVEKAIETSATVLITGETGTGKEIIARAIHYNGPRRKKKFVAQNCGSMTESLLESELFGHVRGAFTGAVKDHRGLFEEADGGTIFLDEVGDMPPPMQVKLLRVLEEGEIRPVGGTDPIRVDVRVISATHKNLREEVEAARFRRDLYYRLDVFRLELPPLRARGDDIMLLARHFFEKYRNRSGKRLAGLTIDALTALARYSFPGNVRELENEIERAVALASDGGSIDVDALSADIRNAPAILDEEGFEAETEGNLRRRMHAYERQLIIEELLAHKRNRTHTAAKLGITVRALQKKIVQLGIKE